MLYHNKDPFNHQKRQIGKKILKVKVTMDIINTYIIQNKSKIFLIACQIKVWLKVKHMLVSAVMYYFVRIGIFKEGWFVVHIDAR